MKALLNHPKTHRLLSMGPVRRFIEKSGRVGMGARLYREWSGLSRIYPSMEAANEAISRHRPETRISDYPALFWMLEICRNEELSVFDFGGGIGQTFVTFSRYLPSQRMAYWMIQDLPEVVSRASRFFPDGVPDGLGFVTTPREAPECNVLFAAGALHYWAGSMSDLFAELGQKPAHVLVNRSPLSAEGQEYYTVQQGDGWAVACKVRSLSKLKAEMEAEGYRLVDSWIDPVKALAFPWLPSFSCPYRGAYFRLTKFSRPP